MNSMTRSLVALVLAVGATACASAGGSPRSPSQIDGDYWDATAIQESGAANAWDALQRLAFSLHPQDDGVSPLAIGRGPQRGFRNTQSTLVVIDGFEIPDLRVLRDIPASRIVSLKVMSKTQALIRYGNDGWNGAIVVETRRGR